MSDRPAPPDHERAPDGERPFSSRRRILRLGTGAAPIILTLASRPVLGSVCQTGSAMGSTLHASHSPQVSTCSGLTVSAWTSASTWPDPYKKTVKHGVNGWDPTLYHCLTTGLNGSTYSTKTMLEVMQLSDGTSLQALGRYIAAALLNARAGKTPVLSESTVRSMWNAIAMGPGFYEPTAGVHWGPAEVIAYIKTTMG